MEVILTTLIALGTGLASSFATWFFGRKKSNIETIDAAVDTWQKVVDSLKKQIDDLLKESELHRNENENLRQEVEKLRIEIEKLKQATKKIERYEKRIKELEEDLQYISAVCDSHNIKYKLPNSKNNDDPGKPKSPIGFVVPGKGKSSDNGDKK